MSVALIALSILWLGLIAYAVLGGADFGAGIWNLFAVGSQADRQRQLINKALGPVWEANHVWLIFLIVGLFSVFPTAFAVLSVALFVPLSIALIGIVMRGSAFIFRTYAIDTAGPTARWWTRVFSTASLVTPFFLGAAAAAVASGRIEAPNGNVQADLGSTWTTPFALTIGAMAVALCATLAAVYLTVEASNEHDESLTEMYRLRAIMAGAVTAVFGGLGLVLSPSEDPILWQGLLMRALPVVIATMVIGLATATALYFRRYGLARIQGIAQRRLTGATGVRLLAIEQPDDPTVESLRSLRTALQFAMLEAPSNRVLITGPTPGVGKSFITANFAALLAGSGKKALMIDADLRRGHLHQYLGLQRHGGLSELIAGSLTVQQTVHRQVVPNLDFLATGQLPPNPGELLTSESFAATLQKLSESYDYVLIDAPPVLVASDASAIAAQAGSVLMVARADVSTMGELKESMRRLSLGGKTAAGVLLNGIDVRRRSYGSYRYGRYRATDYNYESILNEQ